MFNFPFIQDYILVFFKAVFLIFDLFFIVFLFIVLKQIVSMNKLVNEAYDSLILKTVATVNIIIAVSLFLISLVIL